MTLSNGIGFHPPNLDHEFFPGYVVPGYRWIFGQGELFSLDRLMLIRLLMTVILCALFAIGMRNPKIVPQGLQNVIEYFLDFVRIRIAEDILGKKEGRRFLPIIATIFFAVFAMNIPTVIPGLNISPNARIGFPIALAILGYVTMIYAGVKRYGAGKYLKSSVVIPNLPPILHLLVVPIEFLSTFIIRPVTLALRLMANFLAGHLILVLLYSATNAFFWQMNGWTAVSAVTIVAAIAFSLYECIVIFLQAYIFALLVAVYIELSLHADSH